jgi:hypothetical protein
MIVPSSMGEDTDDDDDDDDDDEEEDDDDARAGVAIVSNGISTSRAAEARVMRLERFVLAIILF